MLKPPPSRGRRRLLFARQNAFQWQPCTCKHTNRRGFHCSDTDTKRRPRLSGHSVMILLIKASASFMHLFLGRSHGPLPCLHRVSEWSHPGRGSSPHPVKTRSLACACCVCEAVHVLFLFSLQQTIANWLNKCANCSHLLKLLGVFPQSSTISSSHIYKIQI